MKQNRVLFVVLGIILLLVILSLVLFFRRGSDQDYGAEDMPDGVVRNYVLALYKQDYEKAYDYLKDAEDKPTLSDFKQAFIGELLNIEDTGLQIGSSKVTDDEAIVHLTLVHGGTAPFESSWVEDSDAWLILIEDEWKLSYLPYPYWGWDWYTERPESKE